MLPTDRGCTVSYYGGLGITAIKKIIGRQEFGYYFFKSDNYNRLYYYVSYLDSTDVYHYKQTKNPVVKVDRKHINKTDSG